MRASIRTRRVVLAGALTGATTLGLTLAAVVPSGAAGTTSTTASTSAPACRTSQLAVWRAAPGSGVTGGWYYELQFSDVSSSACSLSGYPRVVAVDRSGHQLGSAASHDPRFAASTVTLKPHRTAHAVLRVSDVGAFSPASCRPVAAAGLMVYPPDRSAARFVPLRFQACSAAGPQYLSVRVVRPGAGIPGVSQ